MITTSGWSGGLSCPALKTIVPAASALEGPAKTLIGANKPPSTIHSDERKIVKSALRINFNKYRVFIISSS
jgi:hypothetical protein